METQDVHTLLSTAERNLHPDYWTRVSPALDAEGHPTSIFSPKAKRLSLPALVHMLAREQAPHALRPALFALGEAAQQLGFRFIDDAKTFEQSQKILRTALWKVAGPFEPAKAA